MIQQQSPPPLPPKVFPQPFPFPQNARRISSQHQEMPLFPSQPQPHPQLVAVKSLISFSSEIIIYSVSYAPAKKMLQKISKNTGLRNGERIQSFRRR